MPKTLTDLKVDLDEDLAEKLQWMFPHLETYYVRKESIDARRRHQPHFVYNVDIYEKGEPLPNEKIELLKIKYQGDPVLIIGSGPAGLFTALRLGERGIPTILFEQGSDCATRLKKINRFWRYGEFDPMNNVGFGEGGAGLYSDGKLITRIKSPHIPYVMDRFIQFGAPEEIRFLANPHVGSDRIRRLLPVLRQRLLDLDCQIHFDTEVTELLVERGHVVGLQTQRGDQFKGAGVVWACGHSAEAMFSHLKDLGVQMSGKSFAMGLRIEHPQKLINQIQYREAAEHPKLGAANYKVVCNFKDTGIGVYSFCMCPGGYILSSGTQPDGLVTNGMSNYLRNSRFANSAIVVSIDHEKMFGSDLFGGLKFRRKIETTAWEMIRGSGGLKELPAQSAKDFLLNQVGSVGANSCPSGASPSPLHQLYPREIQDPLTEALLQFEKKMPGFVSNEALLMGPESRTSCPIRIERDSESLESLSHPGLYPCGEGAGYAGGITSAACDGVRVAEAFILKCQNP